MSTHNFAVIHVFRSLTDLRRAGQEVKRGVPDAPGFGAVGCKRG